MSFNTQQKRFLFICLLCIFLQQISAANLPQLIKKQANLQTQQQQPVHANGQQQQQDARAQQHTKLNQQQQQQQQQQVQATQYVHDSEQNDVTVEALKNTQHIDDELNDPYQLLNEMRPESRLPSSMKYPWNSFGMHNGPPAMPRNPFEHALPPPAPAMAMPMPKFLPFIGYAQPVFIPFPLYLAPEMFYPAYEAGSDGTNDLEDMVMSRAAAGGRRPGGASSSFQRPNSPIYYVRLPPTPYMFVPNMNPSPFGNGFSPLLTYQPMPTFSSFGSVFNLPVNFLANGKPSGIYQMGGASGNDMASSTQYPHFNGGYGTRPPTPSNPYRPVAAPSAGPGFMSPQSFGLASMAPPQHDSKMTSLKRPFVFNGRPEDIYVLPNNFNQMYPETSYY